MNEQKQCNDVLSDSKEILTKPSENTKIKILVSVNLVVGFAFLLNAASQLLSKGNFNSPQRDWIYYPVIIFFMFFSGFSELFHMFRKKKVNINLHRFFAYGTIFILSFSTISLLHTSSNPPLTILFDAWIGIPLLIASSLIINRWFGLTMFLIVIINLLFAVHRIGFDFIYQTGWVFPDPKLISNLVIVIFTYFLVSFLMLFFESGTIDQILRVIPTVVSNIETASSEKKALELDNARMATELSVAQRIQKMVLPTTEELDLLKDCETYGLMEPADEVGGDYYDILQSGNRLFLGIGDVTDHGLASGVVMLMAQSSFRTIIEKPDVSLKKALEEINAIIYKNVQTRMHENRNMTLAIMEYNKGNIKVSGQHETILIARNTGIIEEVDTIDLGIYIGLDLDLPDVFNETTFSLEKGESILLYTDGVTEAFNLDNEEYGIKRLKEAYKNNAKKTMREMIKEIHRDVKSFIGTQKVFDDITLVALKRTA